MAKRPYDHKHRRGINIWLDPELWKSLKVYAIKQDLPLYVVLEQAIRSYLSSNDRGYLGEAQEASSVPMADLLPTV